MKASLVLLSLFVSLLSAQGASQPIASAERLPAHLVYGAFFRHVLALEEAAVEHDKAGRNGDEVRAYYQNALNLTDTEAVAMKHIARDCGDAIHELDIKARRVIDAAWASYPGHRVPVEAKPPAVPEQPPVGPAAHRHN
jgi:hypothetical protein